MQEPPDFTHHLYVDASVGNLSKAHPKGSAIGMSTFFSIERDGGWTSGTSSRMLPERTVTGMELEGIRRAVFATGEDALASGVPARVLVHCDNGDACTTFRGEFTLAAYPGVECMECVHTSRKHEVIELCHRECGETRVEMEEAFQRTWRGRSEGCDTTLQ